MKSSRIIKSINTRNRILIGLGVLTLCFFITSIILHISALKMIVIISDFAVYHYFLTGFISLILFSICLKYYLDNNERIQSILKKDKDLIYVKLNKRRQRIQKFKSGIAQKIRLLKTNIYSKQIIDKKRFNHSDVLIKDDDKSNRQEDLKNAMKLGNSFKHKVNILYKESGIIKRIESIILFVSNEHVTITGGDVIPVKSIYKVNI